MRNDIESAQRRKDERKAKLLSELKNIEIIREFGVTQDDIELIDDRLHKHNETKIYLDKFREQSKKFPRIIIHHS